MTTSKTTGIRECILCHPSILPKAPLLSPSQFSRHFPQHCACTVLNAMSKHDPAQSANCVEYSASKNISRYSITCDNCHSSCIIRGRRYRKLETHSVLADSSQTWLAIMSLTSLKFNSSCKSPLTSYPRSLAQTIYTCSVSCCFCKRNPCMPHS